MHSLQNVNLDQFKADLHSHTYYSDGSASPKELIDHAIEIGLSALSITDHDTVDAYVEAIPYANQKGFCLVSGVEFSAIFKKRNVHILGYGLDIHHPLLHSFCRLQQSRRKDRNLRMLEKLKRFRFEISENDLEELEKLHRTVGRPHIANIMLQKGYVRSIQEAFSIYLGDGRCCYEQGDTASIDEVIDVVKQCRGKVFLAHPHLLQDGLFVKEVLQHDFDGIECYYARCPKEKERRWLKIAKERSLLISGGSDYHGTMKPHIPLGCSWISFEDFSRIFSVCL